MPDMFELEALMSPRPRLRTNRAVSAARIGLGWLIVLVGMVAVVGSVDSDGTPSVGCGGPAFSVAMGGGRSPTGHESECRTSAGDQTLGGGFCIVAGVGLLLGRRLRRWTTSRSTRRQEEADAAGPPMFEEPTIPLDPLRPVEDPGWRPALVALIPIVGIRIAADRRRRHPANALVLMRQLFLSFVMSIAMFAFVVIQLDLSRAASSSFSSRNVLVVVGAIALVDLLFSHLGVRPLDGSTEVTLVQTWRTRFFLRIAFAEVPALAGFVGAFLAGSSSPYFVGAVATLVLFARAAPTAGNLARDQEALRDQSSPLSVLTILATSIPKAQPASGKAPTR